MDRRGRSSASFRCRPPQGTRRAVGSRCRTVAWSTRIVMSLIVLRSPAEDGREVYSRHIGEGVSVASARVLPLVEPLFQILEGRQRHGRMELQTCGRSVRRTGSRSRRVAVVPPDPASLGKQIVVRRDQAALAREQHLRRRRLNTSASPNPPTIDRRGGSRTRARRRTAAGSRARRRCLAAPRPTRRAEDVCREDRRGLRVRWLARPSPARR